MRRACPVADGHQNERGEHAVGDGGREPCVGAGRARVGSSIPLPRRPRARPLCPGGRVWQDLCRPWSVVLPQVDRVPSFTVDVGSRGPAIMVRWGFGPRPPAWWRAGARSSGPCR